jgi:hypothetical protein
MHNRLSCDSIFFLEKNLTCPMRFFEDRGFLVNMCSGVRGYATSMWQGADLISDVGVRATAE